MKKRFLSLIMLIAISLLLTSCSTEQTSQSSQVQQSEKASEDMRIIGGSRAVSEILAKLDIEIVGRPSTQYEIMDEIKDVPEIGFPMNPDLEKIKALKPDIYITSGALQEMIGDMLVENGINTMFCDLDSYDSVKETIEKLAKEFNKEENGKELIAEIEKEEQEILKDINPNKKVKVMILFGAPGHFMLASNNSFAGSLIEKLGAENIASKADISGQYVPFSLETALKENPDIIFRMYHGDIEEAKKQANEEFKNNPQWEKFKAVKEGKIYDLDPECFGVTGDIKIVESLKKMKEYLYE